MTIWKSFKTCRQQCNELRKSQILSLLPTFSAPGQGVHIRLPLRWCSATQELRRIYSTPSNISFEAVTVCQVIHKVYLRVPKHRATQQTSMGSKRANTVYWINNHPSLTCPLHRWDIPWVPLVPGQRVVLEVLWSLTFCSCAWLETSPRLSSHWSFLRQSLRQHRELAASSHHCSAAAHLGPINNAQTSHKHAATETREGLYLPVSP